MAYQDYYKCSICGCKETVQEQLGDGIGEFCFECGMPLESFVEDDSFFQDEEQQRYFDTRPQI